MIYFHHRPVCALLPNGGGMVTPDQELIEPARRGPPISYAATCPEALLFVADYV